jgi:phosphoglycolate phosphatase-like HAD superfamily hydrolase
MNAKTITTIVFDFDGVIVLGSEYAKDAAWGAVFPRADGWPLDMMERVAKSKEKFANGVGSRFDILRDLFWGLGKGETEIVKLVALYAERFDAVVQTDIVRLGVTYDDRTELARLFRYHRLYINSATPEISIIDTVSRLGIARLFEGVYGQPTKKVQNLFRAMNDAKATADQTLFVGDGQGDYATALKVGCHFVGVANDYNQWGAKYLTEPAPFPLIPSISQLRAVLPHSEGAK